MPKLAGILDLEERNAYVWVSGVESSVTGRLVIGGNDRYLIE